MGRGVMVSIVGIVCVCVFLGLAKVSINTQVFFLIRVGKTTSVECFLAKCVYACVCSCARDRQRTKPNLFPVVYCCYRV